jgi:ADP-heptose:LPS heptosyltransferase/protein-S-isoprenylcysteine O-methyltransferase Ste14
MSDAPRPVFRYSLNRRFRELLLWIFNRTTAAAGPSLPDLRTESIKKILIVRATFRLGDALLAFPAVWSFRNQFPHARIDFVGAPIAKNLMQNMPVDNHYTISRRYPLSAVDYPILLKRLRSIHYDFAVDVSCSQSAMGAFLVGLSGARWRAGMQGKWDRWLNIKVSKSGEINKYKTLPRFLCNLGITWQSPVSNVALTDLERHEARKKMAGLTSGRARTRTVGVFVGGRKSWGKRWSTANFCELITALHAYGINVITFVGPEEKDTLGLFRDALDQSIPIVFERSLRMFAAMVSNCDLFVTCDSGPMHLAYSLGVRTVAIFRYRNFDRWGPPPSRTHIVHDSEGCSTSTVLAACYEELVAQDDQNQKSLQPCQKISNLASIPMVNQALNRLEGATVLARLLKIGGRLRLGFVLLLVLYALFAPAGLLEEGSFLEQFVDVLGATMVLVGGLLCVWAISHRPDRERCDRSVRRELIRTGPYAYVQHPLWIANLLIGIGMIFLLDAYGFMFLLLIIAMVYQRVIEPAENRFLEKYFGESFAQYCRATPKYIPRVFLKGNLFLGRRVHLREIGPVLALILLLFLFESIESPHNRPFISTFYRWIRPSIVRTE